MTDKDRILFDVLKASLWGQKPQHDEIPEDVRMELRAQTVEGLTAITYSNNSKLKYLLAASFVKMAEAQKNAIDLMQNHQIPVIVLKGTASGIYYPMPYLRAYGDVDLMVPPEYYETAITLMRDNNYIQEGEVGHTNTALWKDGCLFELHHSPPGMDEVPEGKYMLQFIHSGFANIQTGSISNPKCSFPMLPWQQNGLELIWHFRVHLYNGIGLRHVIDWMMFVHCCLDDDSFAGYREVLEKSGLLVLAKTVTRMCQIYLGLAETITWCRDAPEELCADLMEFVLDQGNFGFKRKDDKAAKVLSKYRTPLHFLKGMQQKGLREWKGAKKYAILRPFAWLFAGLQGCKILFEPSAYAWLRTNRAETRKRKLLFDQLYGKSK